MPLIQVKVIEGVFSKAQKAEMIRKLTDTMVSIEGENMPHRDHGGHRGGEERQLGHRRPADDDGRREDAGRGRAAVRSDRLSHIARREDRRRGTSIRGDRR